MKRTSLRLLVAGALLLTATLSLAGCISAPNNNGMFADENTDQPEQPALDTEMPMFIMGMYALEAGDSAPDFTVQVVDGDGLTGKTISLADLAGKPAVIDFWAPWCKYCVEDHVIHDRLAKEYGDKVTYLAIDAGGDTFGELLDYINTMDYSFTYALTNPEVAAAYPCPGIPYTVIIDQQGTIVYTMKGSYQAKTGMAVHQAIDPLLK